MVGTLTVEMRLLDLEEVKTLLRVAGDRIRKLEAAAQHVVDIGTSCDRIPCPPKCEHDQALNDLAKALEA